MIFVGDSLRGDILTSLIAHKNDSQISGQGILVLKDKNALIQIKKQISEDGYLKSMIETISIYGLVVNDVPLDEEGKPILLSIFKEKFLEKL